MSLNRPFPLMIRAYNRLFSDSTLCCNTFLQKAKKRFPTLDFADDAFIARLDRLCTAVNKEAFLHPFGAFILKERLHGLIHNRLLAVEYLKKKPALLQENVHPPIFITGLQRTGTTFLHRLLATPTDHRALLSWEALNPIPLNHKNDPKKRIRMAKISQQALRYISPIFFSIHPVEYNSPEEDILLNDMTLLSAVHEATLRVPSYAAWVASQDHSIAYDWLFKMLQVLQFGQDNKTWILKTPQHLEYMDVLVKKFPKATVIHTHRHPAECLPSFCSMVYHSRRIFSKQVNPYELAKHWVAKNAGMLQKTLEIRKQHPQYSFIDVYYKDLIKDPVQTIRAIYQQTGKPWTRPLEKSIRSAMLQHQKDKYGKHRYSITDFGLDKQTIETSFSFYLDHYFSSPNKSA